MKKYVITLDTGTTNTRASLWSREGTYLGMEKISVGVRNTAIDGHNGQLKQAVSACLRTLLEKAEVPVQEVAGVFASGMITSNVGLLEVPHLTAPAGVGDFAQHVVRADLPEVSPIPFYFIPGLKNTLGNGEDLKEMDIMRGEEVESLALLQQYPVGTPYLFLLPGSHSKFVFVDEAQRLTGCLTVLTGELLEVITTHTILADSVERSFVTPQTYCKQAVLEGFNAARTQGFGRALFSVRIQKMFAQGERASSQWAANYLLGIVLENDVAALEHTGLLRNASGTVGIVAGKEPFLSGLTDVFAQSGLLGGVHKHQVKDDIPLSARGAFSIARRCLEVAYDN